MSDEQPKKIFEVINSPLFLLIAGFLLTTLLGTYISHSFHEQSWKSKARFEIFKERFNEATEAQDGILSLSNERIMYLKRMNAELKAGRLQSARSIWKNYFQLVKTWNNKIKSSKNKMALLFDQSVSVALLDHKENHAEDPKSLHHIFRKSHSSTLAGIECMKVECEQKKLKDLLSEAQRRLDVLGLAHDNFAEQLSAAVKRKEMELMQ